MTSPYEYYNGKLGVKISFLITDRKLDPNSMRFISYNALFKRMSSKNFTENQLRRASLNYPALVEFHSLCRDWKDALILKFGSPDREVKKSWFAENYEPDGKAWDYFNAYRYGEDQKKLDLKLIETYTYNASVLNTVIKIKNDRKNYCRALGTKNVNIWESLTNDVNAFREVEHKLPSTSRGLRMLVNKYNEEGYKGIISGRLQNTNAAKVKEDIQFAVLDELLAKHQNLHYTLVSEIYNTVAGVNNWPTISEQTVANRAQNNRLVITAGRKGKSELSNKVLMQNKRSAPSSAMLYWTMDGWDAELLYQKTETSKTGHSGTTYHNRLTVVVVLDPFNKYPVGYAIGTHETPELIKAALRNAFSHMRELFGEYYRPYQLQTDNYAIKTLRNTYQACAQRFTPAQVKNAKAKVIEPYFKHINEKYCKLFDNWSGHNVNSGSSYQPNSEYLNKIRHSFPDQYQCQMQLVTIFEQERKKKREAFVNSFNTASDEFKTTLNRGLFLRYLGEVSQFTNKISAAGFGTTINGKRLWFDSFDPNFRKLSHLDWAVFYDPEDLSDLLIQNAQSRAGKVAEIEGKYEFYLEEKHIQPMALAERSEGDAEQLQLVKNYNQSIINDITQQRQKNYELIEPVINDPRLNDTLAKHLLVDSSGQHKNRKSIERVSPKIKEAPVEQSVTQKDINEFNQQKIDINAYL